MKLHTFKGSPNGRKVEAVINHLDLPVEIQHHDFFNGGLRTPQYLAINPNAMTPTLEDAAFVLWESNAIMQYLADRAGGEELFPRAPQQRADIVRWQCWQQSHFNQAFGTLAFETVAKPRNNRGAPDAAVVERACVNLARFAPVLERHLDGRQYLVGANLTLADYSMITFESYRELVPFDWSSYRNINAYFDRVRTVEPWRRAVAANSSAARQSAAA